MNRRGFLSLLGAAVPALALDPEQVLWTPTKTIFDLGARPTTPIVLADYFEASFPVDIAALDHGYLDMVVKAAGESMMHNLRMAHDDEFLVVEAIAPRAITVRLPQRYRPPSIE